MDRKQSTVIPGAACTQVNTAIEAVRLSETFLTLHCLRDRRIFGFTFIFFDETRQRTERKWCRSEREIEPTSITRLNKRNASALQRRVVHKSHRYESDNKVESTTVIFLSRYEDVTTGMPFLNKHQHESRKVCIVQPTTSLNTAEKPPQLNRRSENFTRLTIFWRASSSFRQQCFRTSRTLPSTCFKRITNHRPPRLGHRRTPTFGGRMFKEAYNNADLCALARRIPNGTTHRTSASYIMSETPDGESVL